MPSISICDSIALVMKCSHTASISIWSLAVVHAGPLVDVRPCQDVPALHQCHGNISDIITCASCPRHLVNHHGSSNESMNSHALQRRGEKNREIELHLATKFRIGLNNFHTFGQFLGFIRSHRFATFIVNEFVATNKNAMLRLAREVRDILYGSVILAHGCVQLNSNPCSSLFDRLQFSVQTCPQ